MELANILGIEKLILEQFPGLLWFKNIAGQYEYINLNAALADGYKNPQDMIGTTDYDIRTPLKELADHFLNEDNRILSEKKEIKAICHGRYFETGEYKTWLRKKTPLKNQGGEIIGTLGMAIDVSQNQQLLNTILIANKHFLPNNRADKQFTIEIEADYPGLKISKRQGECLFYLLRGKSLKEISNIMSISPRTVESHITALKTVTESKSRFELMSKCISKGMINIFPEHIFEKTQHHMK